MKQKLTAKDYRSANLFFFGWLFLAWFAYLVALIDNFRPELVYGGAVFILGASLFFAFRYQIWSGLSRELLLASAVLLVMSALFAFSAVPSVFSGRDQGSISEAAIRLVQNQRTEYSTPESQVFFRIYGQGRALNFPGFHYTPEGELVTQFPLAYIAWLALFYSFFGLSGLVVANAVLFFLFGIAFYLLFRFHSESKYALLFALFFLSTFVFSWIVKLTLSENLALALTWVAILGLAQFIRKPEALPYSLALAAFSLLFFTRLEGIFFFATGLIAFFIYTRRSSFWKNQLREKLFIPFFLFLLLAAANLIRNFAFFREIGKTLFGKNKGMDYQILNPLRYGSEIFYTTKVFALYGLLIISLIALFSIVRFVRDKRWERLVPLLVVVPSFIYLFDPNISADHPWMLRRFTFSIIPAFLLFAALGLEDFLSERKKSAWLPYSLALLIALNLYPTGKYFFFSDNRGLLADVKALSRNFSDHDLVLVDSLASGDGWAMPTGPLSFIYGKRAVYFFNPSDFAKLDLSPFDRIFLVVPDSNVSFYQSSTLGGRLIEQSSYRLITTRLDKLEKVWLRQKEKVETSGKIFEIRK